MFAWPQIMAARLQNVQFWEASVPAGLGPTSAQNGGSERPGRNERLFTSSRRTPPPAVMRLQGQQLPSRQATSGILGLSEVMARYLW